jgi:hypothetical protein
MARGDINSSNLGQNERGGALSDRAVEVSVLRVLQNRLGLTLTIIQKMQELTGDRFATDTKTTRPRAAVRRGDFDTVGRIKELKSVKLSAAPTAADYNALRDDVKQIFEALEGVVTALNDAFRT